MLPQHRPSRRTLNSGQIFARFLPKCWFETLTVIKSVSESWSSRVNEHVQELQTTGEGRPTGGGGLQSGPEVPHQAWDAKPHCHRKRKRRGGKVRVQRHC